MTRTPDQPPSSRPPMPARHRSMPVPARHRSMEGNTMLFMSVLIVTTGMALAATSTRDIARRETVQYVAAGKAMQDVSTAIYAYAEMHSRLPCPADPTATASGTIGVSAVKTGPVNPSDPSDPRTKVTGCAVTNGIVPWVTLGLPETASLDRWGWRLSYRLHDGLAAENALGTATPPVAPAGLSVCIIIRGSCKSPEWQRTDIAKAIPFLLVSHGQAGSGAWTRAGKQRTLPAQDDEGEYYNAQGEGDKYTFFRLPPYAPEEGTNSAKKDDYFDDVVTLPLHPRTGAILTVKTLHDAVKPATPSGVAGGTDGGSGGSG